ncbi:hypothetical protein E2320_015826 [Naja naja]|nr:hypothetical protein E2320_015826 [Naja naja]
MEQYCSACWYSDDEEELKNRSVKPRTVPSANFLRFNCIWINLTGLPYHVLKRCTRFCGFYTLTTSSPSQGGGGISELAPEPSPRAPAGLGTALVCAVH